MCNSFLEYKNTNEIINWGVFNFIAGEQDVEKIDEG